MALPTTPTVTLDDLDLTQPYTDPMGGAVPTSETPIEKMRAELANKDRFNVFQQTPADTLEPLTNLQSWKNVSQGFGSAAESVLQGGASSLFGGIGDILQGVNDFSMMPGHPANFKLESILPGSEDLKNYLPKFEKRMMDGKEIPTFMGIPYATSEDYRKHAFSKRITPEFGDTASNELMQGLGSVMMPFGMRKVAELERLALEEASKIPGLTKDATQKFVADYANAMRGIYPEGGSLGATAANLSKTAQKGAKTAGNVARNVEDVTVGNYQRGKVRKTAANAPTDDAYNALRERVTENYEPGMPMYMMHGDKSLLHNPELKKSAIEMEAAGKSREEIWDKLKTARTLDPRFWSQELPGDNIAFHITSAIANKQGLKLPDVLTYPEVYKAYPFLRDYDIQFEHFPNPEIHGVHDSDQKQIIINTSIIGHPSQYGSILHEVSHAISNYEGWPSGGSPTEMPNAITLSAAKTINDLMNEENISLNKAVEFTKLVQQVPDQAIRLAKNFQGMYAKPTPFSWYKYLAGEQQANLDMIRSRMTDEEQRRYFPYQKDVNPDQPTYGMTINPEEALHPAGRTAQDDQLYITTDELRKNQKYQSKPSLSAITPGKSEMAIKPKGGNWLTSFEGELKDQGQIGEYLSKSRGGPSYLGGRSPSMMWRHYIDSNLQGAEMAEFIDHHNETARYKGVPKFSHDEMTEMLNNYFSPDPLIRTPSEYEELQGAFNSWINGPFKNYITKSMGTGVDTDPLVQLAENGYIPTGHPQARNGLADADIARRSEYLVNNVTFNDPYVPRVTALTEQGKSFEDTLDTSIHTLAPAIVARKADEGKLHFLDKIDPTSTKIYELTPSTVQTLDRKAGFGDIKDKVWDDLLSGKETAQTIKNRPIEYFAKQVWVDPSEEAKKMAKDTKAYETWRENRHQQLRPDLTYPDGSKMVIFDQNTFKNAADKNDVIRDMCVDTKDLDHCMAASAHHSGNLMYKGYAPVFEPHTGKPPAKTRGFPIYSHIDDVKQGTEEIASLRAPNGEAKATLQLTRDNDDGKFDVAQIRGKNNLEVDNEYREKVKDWLNVKNDERLVNRVVGRALEHIDVVDTKIGISDEPPIISSLNNLMYSRSIIDGPKLNILIREIQKADTSALEQLFNQVYESVHGRSFKAIHSQTITKYFYLSSVAQREKIVQDIKNKLEDTTPSEEMDDVTDNLRRYMGALANPESVMSDKIGKRFIDSDDLLRLGQRYGIDLRRTHYFKPDYQFKPDDLDTAQKQFNLWTKIVEQERHPDPRDKEYLENLMKFITSAKAPGFKKGGIIKLVQSTNPPLSHKKAELALRNKYA